MKRCVIAGISGLIGNHLVNEFPDGWAVWGLSRSLPGVRLPANRFYHLSVNFEGEWNTAELPEKADAVIHLAQSEHFRDFPEYSNDIFHVNTLSVLRLLDYARRARASTFILASSGGIYGYGENEFSEDREVVSRGDLGFYLGTKLCSEVLAENYSPYMNIIILRFFFVYGPGQRPTMLIPRLVHLVTEGNAILLQGQDGIRINPIYVNDAARSIISALTLTGSHKINIGGPTVLSLREIGDIIGSKLNKKPQFSIQPESKPRHLVGDIRKMTELLGAPSTHFHDGVNPLLASTCKR
ncbi:MAG: NAD-dependent epimerase/dehydratase family protein [Candidatus Omnitrophota bacterium]